MFEVFYCDAVGRVLWIVLLERSIGFASGDWSRLNWTLGFCKFLFRLGCIICLFFFGRILILTWVSCSNKNLLERGIYIIYWFVLWFSKGPWPITGSSGSDNLAWLSSNVYGVSWKEMLVDDWRVFVWLFVCVVGVSWDVIGGDWCGDCWLAILEDLRENFFFI